MSKKPKTLGELNKGEAGIIVKVEENHKISNRLLEMGFLEGTRVEVIHEAPITKDPIAIRVRGTIIALRRSEAQLIEIKNE
ncbi:MAG: ferrous iron transport protein A [Deltaproteobacteria bacterium]|nr:ferrous iron transport protein A [Deltaproteobacteria bacterium]